MSETNRTMICPKCGVENLSWRLRCQTCGTLLHEEDISTVKYHRRGYLWWSALISSLIGAGTAAFVMWFISAFAQGRITDPIGWLFVLFPLCSVAIALKWRLVGGVLLILESSALIGLFIMGVLSLVRTQSGSSFWWILLVPLVGGLQLLASGVLFLLSWRAGRRHL